MIVKYSAFLSRDQIPKTKVIVMSQVYLSIYMIKDIYTYITNRKNKEDNYTQINLRILPWPLII